jgi:hypothetical protein
MTSKGKSVCMQGHVRCGVWEGCIGTRGDEVLDHVTRGPEWICQYDASGNLELLPALGPVTLSSISLMPSNGRAVITYDSP